MSPEAAGRVIAERGADATRFADVAAESGVPVSTLQYYFGSREDLLVAAFRHASGTEIAALEAEVAEVADPWRRLARIVAGAVAGYQAGADGTRTALDRVLALRDQGRRDARRRLARLRRLARPGRRRDQARPRLRPVRPAAEPRAAGRAHDRTVDGVGSRS